MEGYPDASRSARGLMIHRDLVTQWDERGAYSRPRRLKSNRLILCDL